MRLLLIMLLTIFVLAGCSAQRPEGGSYPSTVVLNNIQYGLSVEKVTQDKIGNQLGVVKRIVQPMPKENEESNEAPVGSKLYEIKGIEPNEAIAVEINGEYRKAYKNGPSK
ncbi:NisI/SpaI family lantibiotic immunity lipoprotein [Paenibacillus caui]|uniref:NisI/SpaI family lantibiotic immunity lipoprotein n=1 Tax=Paenibacillus caui TaxID=2873927 RepID=UPI001CA93CD5|nr:NisI/SpaI family lantibiotic immunity lipoprotein [Paenibacillus caui]